MIDNQVSIEQLIIGHALNFSDCLGIFVAEVDWDFFSVSNHKIIAFCLKKIYSLGIRKVDEDSFILFAGAYPGDNKDFGGVSYIRELKSSFNTKTENYQYFVNRFKLLAVKGYIGNNLLEPFLKVLNNPNTDITDVRKCISGMLVEINKVETSEKKLQSLVELEDTYSQELQNRTTRTFYTTGLSDLDLKLTEGFVPQKLSVIAGFTGMAKSTIVVNMAHRIAVKDIGTAIFSMESPDVNVIDKMISTISGIPMVNLMKDTKDLTVDQCDSVALAWQMIRNLPILISHKPSISIDNMRYQIEEAKQRGHKIDVVFIDLFGKLEDVDTGDNLPQKIQRECRRMRELAVDLNVHFVMVLQIGRAGYGLVGSKIKRPNLTHIKNANAYAEECDLCLLLHRNKYYQPDLNEDILEIDIAKQRYGEANRKVFLELIPETATIKSTSSLPSDIGVAG